MTYLDVLGHPTWVHDAGATDGAPVLLLHGGFSESAHMLPMAAALGEGGHRTVAFDRRGHGKTVDTDEPFHYETMAGEAIGVLDALGTGPTHVVGYSDGGGVALWLAHRRPDLVRSMVLIGAGFHHEGLRDDWIDESDPSNASMMATPYAAKEKAMYTTEPTFTVDDLAAMAMPVLLLVGDDDCIHLDHTLAMYEAFPNAQLAVVPGSSHLVVIEKADLVHGLIRTFLDTDGVARTMLPVRRRSSP